METKIILMSLTLIIIILIIIYSVKKYEKFMSLGTIQQLFAKDSQDLYLNGNEIIPIIHDDYLLTFNHPTLITNRSTINNLIDPKTYPIENNDCQGLDFLNNGRCGKIFFNNQFLPALDNTKIYLDQYTGQY